MSASGSESHGVSRAEEADVDDSDDDDGLLLEGFLRFFRTHRTELVQKAGMHLLAPKIPTLAHATAEAWASLSLARKMKYHDEALCDIAKIDPDADWVSQMQSVAEDLESARTSPYPSLFRDCGLAGAASSSAAPPADNSKGEDDDEEKMAEPAPNASQKATKRRPKQQVSKKPSHRPKAMRIRPNAVSEEVSEASRQTRRQRRRHTKNLISLGSQE